MQTRTIIDKIEIEPQTDNIRAEMRQVIDDDGVTDQSVARPANSSNAAAANSGNPLRFVRFVFDVTAER
jgi:hypothetical protein